MPPNFSMVQDLMHMPCLDAPGAGGLLAVGFRFTDHSADPWTQRFNAFKSRDALALAGGTRTLVRAFSGVSFKNTNRVVVVGAISSGDAVLASDSPVSRLGAALAAAKGWEWRHDLLRKRPHRPLHTIFNAAERDAEIDGAAYIAGAAGGAPGLFLIVDDFCTRGSTFGKIRAALLASNPGWSTYGAALAKTERVVYWAERGGISNDHIPEHLSSTWQVG